ncbi:hypothetical protein CB1_000602039 [Camelus ferus]|nr:hypothetical protein CB1_000602039 [Camelus ferus]
MCSYLGYGGTKTLRLLHWDLGLAGPLSTDICGNVAFFSLVDPISHNLLVNLARDLQCPKSVCELRKSSGKGCKERKSTTSPLPPGGSEGPACPGGRPRAAQKQPLEDSAGGGDCVRA